METITAKYYERSTRDGVQHAAWAGCNMTASAALCNAVYGLQQSVTFKIRYTISVHGLGDCVVQ